MALIEEIRARLAEAGHAAAAEVTEANLREALRRMPRRPALGVPDHADDTADPWPAVFHLTEDQRRMLRLAEPERRLAPRRAPVARPGELRSGVDVLGDASLKPLESASVSAAPGPQLRVRVHMLCCRNSDGKLSDGSAAQGLDELKKAAALLIPEMNEIFAGTGIELVCLPDCDVEIRNDTFLNQDYVIPAADQHLLSRLPPLSQQEMDALAAKHSTTAHRNAVAKKHKGKLVLLFAEGTTHAFNATSKRWVVSSPSGGGFSWEDLEFVKLSAVLPTSAAWAEGYATFAAHEVGHNLHLWHPFVQFHLEAEIANDPARTDQQKADVLIGRVEQFLNKRLAEGVPAADIVKELDGDRAVIADTPPDDSGEIIHYLNRAASGGDACGLIGTVEIDLTAGSRSYKPDRSLVMSYFKGCTNFHQHFSPGQATRMRTALMEGNRRHMVAVQLGDTASPNDRVCAVWSPSTAGQLFVWNYAAADFEKKYAEMFGKGFRLHQQRTMTSAGGAQSRDGIWNPSQAPQRVVWGWTVEHFAAEDKAQAEAGMRLARLESFLLPGGQVRVNAVWNPGAQASTWVQGWAPEHLSPKLDEMHGQGWRVADLTAWLLAPGAVRYDVVWTRGTHAVWVDLGLSDAGFSARYGERWNQGFRLLTLDAHQIGGGFRYDAVWVLDTRPQFVCWGKTREQVQDFYGEMWCSGMKLLTTRALRAG